MYKMIYQVMKSKKGKREDMDGSDRIVSMIYIRKDILSVRTYCFIIGKSISIYIEHIKERIADFFELSKKRQEGPKSHVTLFRKV